MYNCTIHFSVKGLDKFSDMHHKIHVKWIEFLFYTSSILPDELSDIFTAHNYWGHCAALQSDSIWNFIVTPVGTRKSLPGIVLAAVVVKDLQLNYLCRTVDDMPCHYPSPDSPPFL